MSKILFDLTWPVTSQVTPGQIFQLHLKAIVQCSPLPADFFPPRLLVTGIGGGGGGATVPQQRAGVGLGPAGRGLSNMIWPGDLIWLRQFLIYHVKSPNEKVCQVWFRCSSPCLRYRRKNTEGSGQNDPHTKVKVKKNQSISRLKEIILKPDTHESCVT